MTDMVPPPGYEDVHPGSTVGFGRSVGPLFIDKARCRLAFRVGPDHVNGTGFCHGGALATFADSQVSAIRAHAFEAKGHSPTISLTIDYLAGIPLGALVEMQVTLLRKTRTMLFTQALLTVDGENVARSNGIYRYYDRPRADS